MASGEDLRSLIDTFFRDVPYVEPTGFKGEGLFGVMSKERRAVDPLTGQSLHATDRLTITDISTADNPISLDAARLISLCRGESSNQVVLNYSIDEDSVSVRGVGAALFRGNPREEFIAGLKTIEAHETHL